MSPASFGKLKVLVIDDQQEIRDVVKCILNGLGIDRVFEAGDGRTALTYLQSAEDLADIVVCDWNMPEMDGVTLLKEIRTLHPEMPFMMITGRDDYASVNEAKELGVTAYLRKPISATQMEEKLRFMHLKTIGA